MLAFRDHRGNVEVAFTDARVDVRDPLALIEVAGSLTGSVPTVATMHQVHGSTVALVDEPAAEPDADALVTARPGLVLAVRAADCVPVILADADAGVVAAVHAGRRGLAAGVVRQAVDRMRRLGAERLVAWLGPHACGRCYEVPEQMRAAVAAVVPEAWAETSWRTPSVDLGAGVAAALGTEGAEVTDVGRCTIEDRGLFSYRRDGRDAGRQAGLVWIRP